MTKMIYGAQSIALGTYKALQVLQPNIKILGFLVTSKEGNPSILSGIPVFELSDFVAEKSEEEKKKIVVYIATPENVMPEIEKALDACGLYQHVRIDSVRWAEMQKLAFVKSGKYMPLETYPVGYHRAELKLYKMVHHKDKPLQNVYSIPEYITSFQVGAVNADRRVADLFDYVEDNISARNGNYSELTGLYWIWKNRLKQDVAQTQQYSGLVHYRRLFDLSEDDLLRLCDNEIDVVLPYPMPYEPDIEMHHKRYLSDEEWGAVLKALEELQPEYAWAFQKILRQEYFFNYNIIIAKNEVLETYCDWLFPLLFRIEELNDPEGIKKPNRFIGYVGETLETLYFMYNRDHLRIAYTGCRFLV